tara:strand:- start:166691 stop:167341 length:651 start_codon:yes stop_codon:yes gene_type:complete
MDKYYRRSLIKPTKSTQALNRACVVFTGLVILLFSVISSNAFAHGGATMDKDKCAFRTAGKLVHFTAYQPVEAYTKELCKSVVTAEKTILVFDFVDESLRTIPIQLRIDKIDPVSKEAIDFLTLPGRLYSSGTTNIEIKNIEEGDYRISVDLHDTAAHSHSTDTKNLKHNTGTFGFSVKPKAGDENNNVLKKYSWLLYVLGAGLLLYFLTSKFRSR